MSTLTPGLTDSESRILLDLARPLSLREREKFMLLVDERLRGHGGDSATESSAELRANVSAEPSSRRRRAEAPGYPARREGPRSR
jgi:hypothetical protein